MGDYKDKTVTFEDFPFHDGPVKTASVHPCRHAAVMKLMLDRADAALKIRKAKGGRSTTSTQAQAQAQALKAGRAVGGGASGDADPVKGLVEGTKGLSVEESGVGASTGPATVAGARSEGDEWEVLQHGDDNGGDEEDEPAIRVDQYIVVFLKFIASVTPGIEHDFTMGV